MSLTTARKIATDALKASGVDYIDLNVHTEGGNQYVVGVTALLEDFGATLIVELLVYGEDDAEHLGEVAVAALTTSSGEIIYDLDHAIDLQGWDERDVKGFMRAAAGSALEWAANDAMRRFRSVAQQAKELVDQ